MTWDLSESAARPVTTSTWRLFAGICLRTASLRPGIARAAGAAFGAALGAGSWWAASGLVAGGGGAGCGGAWGGGCGGGGGGGGGGAARGVVGGWGGLFWRAARLSWSPPGAGRAHGAVRTRVGGASQRGEGRAEVG